MVFSGPLPRSPGEVVKSPNLLIVKSTPQLRELAALWKLHEFEILQSKYSLRQVKNIGNLLHILMH